MSKKTKQVALTQFPGFSLVEHEPPSGWTESQFPEFNPDNQVVIRIQQPGCWVSWRKRKAHPIKDCEACKAWRNANYNHASRAAATAKWNKRRRETGAVERAAKYAAYEKLTLGDTADTSGTTVNLTTSRLVRSILTPACADENVSSLVGIGAELVENQIAEERVRLGGKNGPYTGTFVVSIFGASTGSISIENEGNLSGTTLTLTPCLCPQYSILTPAYRPQ